MIMLAFTIMPFIGEGTVAYNYVRTRFEWEYEEYSEYSSITNAISIVGQAVLIPLIGKKCTKKYHIKYHHQLIISSFLDSIYGCQ